MNLYVGNINFDATEDDVKALFEEIGQVDSIKIMLDMETGQSKGFGFIEMPDTEEAVIAMKTLNKRLFFGREILVNLATQDTKQDKPDRKKSFGDRPQGDRGSYNREQRPRYNDQPRSNYQDRPKTDYQERPRREYDDSRSSNNYQDRPRPDSYQGGERRSFNTSNERPSNPFESKKSFDAPPRREYQKREEEIPVVKTTRPRIKRERIEKKNDDQE